MKIYVKCRNNRLGKETEILLKSMAIQKGHEIVINLLDADVVWHQVSQEKEIPEVRYYEIYKDFTRDFVYFTNKSGKINTYKLVPSSKNGADVYYRIETERQEIKVPFTQEQTDKLEKEIMNYLLGKSDKIEVLKPFPLISVLGLAVFYGNRNRDKKTVMYNHYKNKLGLNDQEINILVGEYASAQSFGDSELVRMIRTCKEIYTSFLPIGNTMNNVILNNSDSVVQNLFKMMNNKVSIYNIESSKTKSSEAQYWKEYYIDQYLSETNKLVATVRESILGSKNSFTIASKESEMQMGVYSLYIPDNSLKDGEIMIPHPKHMGIKSQVLNVNGNTITILHTRKCVVIDGPDAYNPELIKQYSSGKFTGYEVYQDKIVLDKIREYPAIGDYVTATRHPITTLICRLKVVGYTTDGSIRCNVKTALALKGDADGDSWSVSWSKWSDSLIYADAIEINKYCDAVGLKLDDSEMNHQELVDMFDEFINSTPDDPETALNKSSESGLEQATAKIKTAELTGKFGAIARDIVQTLFINGEKSNYHIIEGCASISQTLVQLKNVQADLKKGIISEQLIKDFYCIYIMKSRNLLETANLLSELLDITPAKATEMLCKWFGITADYEEIEEKETQEEHSFKDMFKDFINM